jgi:hypothetical protein
MANLLYTQTKLPMLKKKGITKPDEDGYYTLVLGGLECHNNTGAWFYTSQGVKKLFEPGSILRRRIDNGCLRAEVNHPRQMPGEKDDDFFARQLDIDLNNTCAHFKEIWLDEDFGKNHPEYGNPRLIAIMGKVKPEGPKAEILREALTNDRANICFSIRALVQQELVRGKVVRTIEELVTIDLVNEGGITVASKWDSPATESINDTDVVEVTARLLNKIAERSKESAFATESSIQLAAEIRDRYYPAEQRKPIWASW